MVVRARYSALDKEPDTVLCFFISYAKFSYIMMCVNTRGLIRIIEAFQLNNRVRKKENTLK